MTSMILTPVRFLIAGSALGHSAFGQTGQAHVTLAPAAGRTSGGDGDRLITNDAVLGEIADSHASTVILHHSGFSGQLCEPVMIEWKPDPAEVPEESSLQLSAQLHCDDDTTLPLGAAVWDNAGSPDFQVTGAGMVIATAVAGTVTGAVRIHSGGLRALVPLRVLDTSPDNIPPFAGDGLNDAWQLFWFAGSPESGGPDEDPDGDGHDNRLEALAGTSPLNGRSFLQTRIEPDPSRTDARKLIFSPWMPFRSYTWEQSDNAATPWLPVPGAAIFLTAGGEAQATDSAAAVARRFYRLRVE